MRHRTLLCFAIVAAFAGAAQAENVDLTGPAGADAPESVVLVPVRALRANDLGQILDAMSAEDRAAVEEGWKQAQQEEIDPAQAMQFQSQFGMLRTPGAADVLMAMAQPQLQNLQPMTLAGGIGMLQMQLQGMMAQNPDLAAHQGLQTLVQMLPDVQAWVMQAGLNDPEKLKQVLVIVTAWAAAQDFETLEQLKAKSLDEVIAVGDSAVVALKKVIAVYGGDVDATLDSVEVSSAGEGDERELTVTATLFGKPRTSTSTVQLVDGRWQVKPDDALMQQLLGGMMMGGMGGGGAMVEEEWEEDVEWEDAGDEAEGDGADGDAGTMP